MSIWMDGIGLCAKGNGIRLPSSFQGDEKENDFIPRLIPVNAL